MRVGIGCGHDGEDRGVEVGGERLGGERRRTAPYVEEGLEDERVADGDPREGQLVMEVDSRLLTRYHNDGGRDLAEAGESELQGLHEQRRGEIESGRGVREGPVELPGESGVDGRPGVERIRLESAGVVELRPHES